MKRFGISFAAIAMVAAFILATAGLADAQRRNDREIRDTLRNLTTKIEDFDYGLTDQMRSSSATRDQVSEFSDDIRGLQNAVRDFQRNFDAKRANGTDANRLVDAARLVDQFLVTYPQNRRMEDSWNAIRGQIDRLTSNYGVTTNWNNNSQDDANGVRDDQPPILTKTQTVGLSGTYSLDVGKSERLDDAIGNVDITADQKQDLKDKLEAPTQVAIDIRGNQITLATSNASPVTVFADGKDKTEPDGKGASIRLRATLNGDTLTISSLGGETDYTVTFKSDANGQILKVSRRITTDYLSQTVFAESVYNKTDTVAGLGIKSGGTDPIDQNGGYSDNDQGTNPSSGGYPSSGQNPSSGGNRKTGGNVRPVTGRTGDFIVPNGVIITGTLENAIDTKASQNNDRFVLTVQSPNEYQGARIEGSLTGVARSGRVTGRSAVTFNFEKITLADGKTYDFAGYLQSVRDVSGKDLNVDAEGTIKGDNQGKQTATRGAVGAGLGALIGLIAGGGRGAAVGAIIGGGAGAGSVAIQGRDDLRLQRGSTITLQSSSPIRSNTQDK